MIIRNRCHIQTRSGQWLKLALKCWNWLKHREGGRERGRERGREGGREERTQRREEGRGWSVEEEVNWRQNGKVSKFLQLSPDTFDSFNSFDQWKMIQLKRISGQIGTGPVPPTKEARWPRSLFTFKVSKELLLLVVSLVGLLLSRHTNTTTHPASWGLEQVAFRSHTMINDVAYTLLFRKKKYLSRIINRSNWEKKKRQNSPIGMVESPATFWRHFPCLHPPPPASQTIESNVDSRHIGQKKQGQFWEQ